MGYLYLPRGSTVWWCKWYQDGKAVRESTKTRKKGEAKDFLSRREGAKAKGEPVPVRFDKVTYTDLEADLLDHYRVSGKRNLKDAEGRVQPLTAFFQRYRAAAIRPPAITAYAKHRQAAGLANATINRELSILRKMLRLAVRNGKVHAVPHVDMLQEPPARQGFFEPEQWAAVRKRLPEDVRVACDIGYTFAWRIKSEVLTLQRRHVDLDAGTIRLDPGSTKNKDGRIVYLTPDLTRLLREQFARVDRLSRESGRIIPHVFPHLTGRFQGERIGNFRQAWQTACRRAGMPGKLVHDFRRTGVRDMVRKGIPERVAMQISGHKSRSVFERYNIVSDGDLRRAAESLSRDGHKKGIVGAKSLDAPAPSMQN